MKILAIISLYVAMLGCSGPHATFKKYIEEFSVADVTKSNNTLFIGQMFPNGKEVQITNSQAEKLQNIFSHAQIAPEDYAKRGATIYPDFDLCYLEIAGKTWYFIPPAEPHRFRLPIMQKKQFEQMMLKEFSLKKTPQK